MGKSEIECKDYKKLPGSKRCQHFVEGGACRKPDYFMCVEWVKANPGKSLTAPETPSPKDDRRAEPRQAESSRRMSEPKPKYLAKADNAVYERSRDGSYQLWCGPKRTIFDRPELITVEAVDELARAGVEAEIKTAGGRTITLVPKYTSQERDEMTFRDARTLLVVMQIFPGSTLESFKKPKKSA